MKKSVLIILSFILFTIIGTLSHEAGHILPAKILGYQTTLHYGSMEWISEFLIYSNTLYKKYATADKIPQEESEHLNKLKSKEKNDNFWILIGGPVQTIVTGMLGMVILYRRKHTLNKTPFGLINWLGVFLSLFWSRQIFNFLIGGLTYLSGRKNTPFGGDEVEISMFLGLPNGTAGIFTAMLAILICSFIVFLIVPRQDRKVFISSGIIGSVLGYLIWFEWIGPWILP